MVQKGDPAFFQKNYLPEASRVSIQRTHWNHQMPIGEFPEKSEPSRQGEAGGLLCWALVTP